MRSEIRHFIFQIICLFILLFQDTLTSWSFNSTFPWFYYFSLAVIFIPIVCFSGICCDPGFIQQSNDNTIFFCSSCQIVVPVRAFHCDKCHHCVQDQIFHSDFANRCIGLNNRLLYYCFLASQTLFLFWMIIETIISFYFANSFENNFIFNRILLIIIFPLNLFYFVQCLILLLQFTYLAFTNSNVLETKTKFGIKYLKFQNSNNNPFFSQEFLTNLSYYFMPVNDDRQTNLDIQNKSIQQSEKFQRYCEDIQNYKGISVGPNLI